MAYKRILTVQDISCVGQCSATVALPILSVCGHESCILPSAVLSTHTGGFHGNTFRDLTADFPAVIQHWEQEKINFDCIYTGYLGSEEQINRVKDLFDRMLAPGGLRVVDPAMADNGKLYSGFDEKYAEKMAELCHCADILIPNITESCMLTGETYRENYDLEYIQRLLEKLSAYCGFIVLTGVGIAPDKTGAAIYRNGEFILYSHEKICHSYHGTGDIFASAFVGALLQEKQAEEAVKIAADFTAQCIRNTAQNPAHWYGVKFETALPYLSRRLFDERREI